MGKWYQIPGTDVPMFFTQPPQPGLKVVDPPEVETEEEPAPRRRKADASAPETTEG